MDNPRPVHVRVSEQEACDQELVGELTALLATAGDFDEMAERMALLSDPRRLRILFCIHAHPGVRSSDIALVLGAHDSTTSHALALLREAGWVRAVRSGREVRYELADGFAHDLLHELGSDHLPGVHHHEHAQDDGHDHGHTPDHSHAQDR